MLEKGLFETEVRRIGAEQEMFLVDRGFRPALVAIELLERIDDPHFTTELGRSTSSATSTPSRSAARSSRDGDGSSPAPVQGHERPQQNWTREVVLCGILPTLEKADLDLENMTPRPRYFALNEAMNRMRGGEYHLYIKGSDELNVTHDNVMLEACNTSFQVHFQVKPENFARLYNIAQAVAAPVLPRRSTPPCFSAGNSGGRPASRSFSSPSIPVRQPDISRAAPPGQLSGGSGSTSR